MTVPTIRLRFTSATPVLRARVLPAIPPLQAAFRNDGTAIQWRVGGTGAWTDIVYLVDITGPVARIGAGIGVAVDSTDITHPVISLGAPADVRGYLDTASYVASRTVLKALDTTKDTTAYLTESGREGTFVFRSGDYSALVAADTSEINFIAADDAASTSGAWVRAQPRDTIGVMVRVRAVATSNVALSTGLAAGQVVDGVTLAVNDLVLLGGQTTSSENGIYTVPASGAASRTTAFNTYDSMPGVYISVMEGTSYADSLWHCTSDKGGTLGTTGLVFAQFSSTGGEVVKTSAYTVLTSDAGKTIVLNKATADTLSFGAAATLGSSFLVRVKNIGAGTWTLAPNGAETIDGVSSVVVPSGGSVIVTSSGSVLRTMSRALAGDGKSASVGSGLYPVVGGFRYDTSSALIANTMGAKFMLAGTPAVDSSTTWLNTYISGIDANATVAVYGASPNGKYGAAFAARSSDNASAGANIIGSISMVLHDNASVSQHTWAQYILGVIDVGAAGGNHINEEHTIYNQKTAVQVDPFNVNPSGSVTGIRIDSGNGGGGIPGSAPTSVGTAIDIVNNGAAFLSGIVFQSTSLDTVANTHPDAIALPPAYAFTWYSAAATKVWQLYSDTGANGNLNVTTTGTGSLSLPKTALTDNLTLTKSNNGGVSIQVNNSNSGSSATATFVATTDAGSFTLKATSNAGGAAAQFLWSGASSMLFDAQNATGNIVFRTGSSLNTAMKAFSNQGVSIGGASDPGANNLKVVGSIGSAVPTTVAGTTSTVGVSDSSIIYNASGTHTTTLPAAATYPGRWLHVKSIAAQAVNSASSNVVPIGGGAAGTAILAATAGKWALLQSDGTNWIIMAAN